MNTQIRNGKVYIVEDGTVLAIRRPTGEWIDPCGGRFTPEQIAAFERLEEEVRTFCTDGATREPWGLADFAEANDEDDGCDDMLAQIRALAVGESVSFGGGAVATTLVTRLS